MNNNGLTIWLTGLSGSGKTTISNQMKIILTSFGYDIIQLDGDDLRLGLNRDLGFSMEDRDENIRRASEVCKIINKNGVLVIASFISPLEKNRLMAKNIIGDSFREIYIKTPIEICKDRDPKGLYKKVTTGEIKNFTGIDSPYEEPKNPFLTIETEKNNVYSSARNILTNLNLI